MDKGVEKGKGGVQAQESLSVSPISRRTFLQLVSATPLVGTMESGRAATSEKACFTIVDHSHQCGLGWFFRDGTVGRKRYHQAFSIFYNLQKTIDALNQFPGLSICLEFDSHAYEAIQEEDAQFVREEFHPLVASGRIDIVGGTYSEPYSQLIGWQSNVRQLVEGRAVARDVLRKEPECFVAEEINFYPQLPQLLRRCGFAYASLQVQNSGSMPLIKEAIINWRGLDGSEIPTVPSNPWTISLEKQYQSLASYADQAAEAQGALLTLWAEIWPPGLDWGASYLPYAEGLQSLREKGLQSFGFSEYMRRRCKPGSSFKSQYLNMDSAQFAFGWPQNVGALGNSLGGWGYEGDWWFKENRRLEQELNATELLLSSVPEVSRSKRLRDLWKKFMATQNHDCVVVSAFPAEYEQVRTTNLEVVKMINREVESGIRQLRQEAVDRLATGHALNSPAREVICQNPTGVPVRQPVVVEFDAEEEFDYALVNGHEEVELQLIKAAYVNEHPRLLGVLDLPSCGFKTYALRKGGPATAPPRQQSGEIANEFYSVKWDDSRKGFTIFDKARSRTVLFRPFAGEIIQVTESCWAAPNSGAKFRAKNFSEVPYSISVEASGPIYHALAARGNLLTLTTTQEIPVGVIARAVLHKGIRRLDVLAEFRTFPQLGLRALAELEMEAEDNKTFRDFPFGEEESHKEQFSALNYVRLQSPGFSVLLAHGGTQQFFCQQHSNHVVLRNMIAREILKGHYRWSWSITTGSSFTPAESYRFAEAFWGPVVWEAEGQHSLPPSLVSVNDPALVIFRFGVESGRARVWLVNYSGEEKQAEVSSSMPLRSCHRVDLEGKPVKEKPALLGNSGKTVNLNLSPWEIAALDLECA
jgi:hypothetical protein